MISHLSSGPRHGGPRVPLGLAVALTTAVGLLAPGSLSGQASSATGDPGLPGTPGFRDILSLPSVAGPVVSPDGRLVAYTRSVPDWDKNRPVRELWIHGGDGDPARIATEADGFRGGAQWTPDGEWLAYRAVGETPALTLRSADGQRTRTVELVEGVSTVRFSPDGSTAAVVAREPRSDRARREQALYGPFSFRDEGSERSHVWLIGMDGTDDPRRLTFGEFTVTDLDWSPDGTEIAFSHQPDAGRNSWWKSDLSVVEVSTGEVRSLVAHAGPDERPLWSPDGESIAFLSTLSDSITNLPMELVVVAVGGGASRVVTSDLPTEPDPVTWNEEGIWFTALEGVENHLFRLDPVHGSIARFSQSPYLVRQASVSADGSAIAFSAATPDRLGEVYLSHTSSFEPRTLTNVTDNVRGWDVGSREVVRWAGPGGAAIEGILHKPSDYDPGLSYPLLVIVHGGPRAVSTPALSLNLGVYPVTHFLRKGALVLQPNYRGSTGYGGEFRQLHGRGLGWGDAGDVEAGVAHLVAEGMVDPDRVGVMGWSYGGFISAYLTATSQAFQAVSVGAGISDWRTHYAWEPGSYTTRFYSFDAAPWEDPNAYAVASPITYINNASTPTLIQHVDGDPVVTVLNAYELQHALQDLGVENRFVVYPGQSHGVGPLKQRLGGLWHNWQWFLKHIWGEEVELPLDPVLE